ncbi:MAG: 3-deoxy-manno-octulosonate cytidylyltransferase [Deltaproteobacteria bacterium RBG_13_53_10]|nr:MAG: 3-deoxy-manno-octulosonate cytidylyltransferase [Deltaproteobacteria bacterium RBG_13_53_10]
MRVVAVIPARYRSTRFEGKPLADILGRPLIQHVYEGVCQSRLIHQVIVATDDERILEAVRSFGGTAVMTSPDHPTGTDRVAEVARRGKADIIVNVQGDEPLITGPVIDKAIRPLLKDNSLSMSTLMTRIEEVKDWLNPHIVKVVVDQKGCALYFSRSPVPFPRDLNVNKLLSGDSHSRGMLPHRIFKHIGVYVYRRSFLLRYSKMKPTPLEKLERLEQLRALENGYRIKVTTVEYEPVSVDTPEDLQKVIQFLSRPKGEDIPADRQ